MHKKKQHDEKQCSGMQLAVLGRTRKAEITDTFDPEQGGTLYRNTFYRHKKAAVVYKSSQHIQKQHMQYL